jgi:hypothetical protein
MAYTFQTENNNINLLTGYENVTQILIWQRCTRRISI